MATIAGVYLALFGRPADPLGLAFFSTLTGNGADLAGIGDLAATDEYQSRFTGLSPVEIVATIYRSLFNRDAEIGGLQFFVDELTSGRQTINTIAINILDGAQGDDRVTVDNKLVASLAFTAAIDTPAEIAAYQGDAAAAQGAGFLAGITADPATIPDAAAVAAALAGIGGTGGPAGPGAGQLFILTTGADHVTGTPGDDVFRAFLDGGLATLNSDDVINGGGGNDRLEAIMVGPGTINPALAGIGNVFLDMSGGGAFDASQSGEVTLWASDLGASFVNVGTASTIGIGSAARGTVSAAFSTEVGFVKLDGTSGVTFNAAGATNLTMTVVDDSALTLAGPQVKSVYAKGSGDFTLSVQAPDALERITVILDGKFELSPLFFKSASFTVVVVGDDESKIHLVAADPTQTTSVTGGDGSDEIRTGISTDRIYARGGDDTVVSGPGADIIELGGGLDIAIFRPGDSDDSPTNMTTIADFGSNDKIGLGTFDSRIIDSIVELQDVISKLDPAATLRNALDIAEEYATANARIAHFKFQGNTYVYVDETNPSTGAYAAGDLVVKLTGEKALGSINFEL